MSSTATNEQASQVGTRRNMHFNISFDEFYPGKWGKTVRFIVNHQASDLKDIRTRRSLNSGRCLTAVSSWRDEHEASIDIAYHSTRELYNVKAVMLEMLIV